MMGDIYCPIQTAPADGVNNYQPTFPCLNLNNTSATSITNYINTAKDIGENTEASYYTTSNNGLWTEMSANSHQFYYTPIYGTSQFIRIPDMPNSAQRGPLQYAVFSDSTTKTDKLLGCGYTTYQESGINKLGIHAELATKTNNSWNWSSPSTDSLPILNPDYVCQISANGGSYDERTIAPTNYSHDIGDIVWIYAAQPLL